jgi:hypothetical protein
MYTPKNTDENNAVCIRTPGKMNDITSAPSKETADPSPPPMISNQSSGLMIDEITLDRSLRNTFVSLYHKA